MSVKAIPEGYHSITAYLAVHDARQAIEFYQRALGASVEFQLDTPDGKVGHAELRIGDSRIMLSEPCAQGPLDAPDAQGKPAVGLHLYVEDVDARYRQAIEAGGEPVSEVQDQFYGDRSGSLRDPYGHLWFIATHKEDLSPEQIRERAEQAFGSRPS